MDEVTEMYGYAVRRDKEAFADLLFDAATRLGALRDDKTPNLRRLAESLGRSPMTLINNLVAKGPPELGTLQDLAAKAGIPVERSLVSLAVLSPREAENKLTPARERMIDALRGLHEDQVRELAHLVLQLRASGSDPEPGPKP